jgi:hypothetical protein
LNEYQLPTPKQSIDYMVYFDALNGHWTEKDSLRLLDGKWYEAIQVVRDDPSGVRGRWKLLLTQIEPGYPIINGKPDWKAPYFE